MVEENRDLPRCAGATLTFTGWGLGMDVRDDNGYTDVFSQSYRSMGYTLTTR